MLPLRVLTSTQGNSMNACPCQLLHTVTKAIANREINASVKVRLEPGSMVVLSAVAQHNDTKAEITSRFMFDGDMIVLRGFGEAADLLEMRVGMARHMGLIVE